jgi:hypothetical protein
MTAAAAAAAGDLVDLIAVTVYVYQLVCLIAVNHLIAVTAAAGDLVIVRLPASMFDSCQPATPLYVYQASMFDSCQPATPLAHGRTYVEQKSGIFT